MNSDTSKHGADSAKCCMDKGMQTHCMNYPCPPPMPCPPMACGRRVPPVCVMAGLILLLVVAIIALAQAGKCNKAANGYRDELVQLADMEWAIEVADTITDPKEKTDAKKEIIETLLNRCNA